MKQANRVVSVGSRLSLLVLFAALGCAKATSLPGEASGEWVNGHPTSATKCSVCHSSDHPSDTTAVGVVAATATTPGIKFLHTSALMAANDCYDCHGNTYSGQVGGWAHGVFGARHSEVTSNCAQCHETPTATITGVSRQTANGNVYIVQFHQLTPTGFTEDPGAHNDCSTCHSHSAGFNAGTFGPSSASHLKDSANHTATKCTDCHSYPADFTSPNSASMHTYAQNHSVECGTCHTKGSAIGGFSP